MFPIPKFTEGQVVAIKDFFQPDSAPAISYLKINHLLRRGDEWFYAAYKPGSWFLESEIRELTEIEKNGNK
jgi:hypothetical protein